MKRAYRRMGQVAAASLVLFTALLVACHEAIEPELCVFTGGEGIETATCSRPAAIDETSAIWIRYRLPSGIHLDEPIHIELATPCSCVAFDRSPLACDSSGATGTGTGTGSGGAASHPCDSDTDEVLLITKPPKGAACSLRISVIAPNSTTTLQLSGESSACAFDASCTPVTTCPAESESSTSTSTSGSTSSSSSSSAGSSSSSG